MQPPKKCPLCGHTHSLRDWPRRHAEGLPRNKVRHLHGIIVDSGHVRTDGETMDMINFSHDLCKGKLMVDSGATTSVAGLRVIEHHHEDCQQNLGSAESDSQPTIEASLMLAFANEQARSSLAVFNMPCCFAVRWGSVPVHVLDAPSPLLLSVDITRDLELNINFTTRVAHSGQLKHETCLQSMGTSQWAIDMCAVESGIGPVVDESLVVSHENRRAKPSKVLTSASSVALALDVRTRTEYTTQHRPTCLFQPSCLNLIFVQQHWTVVWTKGVLVIAVIAARLTVGE